MKFGTQESSPSGQAALALVAGVIKALRGVGGTTALGGVGGIDVASIFEEALRVAPNGGCRTDNEARDLITALRKEALE